MTTPPRQTTDNRDPTWLDVFLQFCGLLWSFAILMGMITLSLIALAALFGVCEFVLAFFSTIVGYFGVMWPLIILLVVGRYVCAGAFVPSRGVSRAAYDSMVAQRNAALARASATER